MRKQTVRVSGEAGCVPGECGGPRGAWNGVGAPGSQATGRTWAFALRWRGAVRVTRSDMCSRTARLQPQDVL